MSNLNDHSSFAKRFDDLLYQKKMTASEVSKRSGISEASLSKYRKGQYMPQGQNLLSIANALGVTADYLLGVDDPPKAYVITNQPIRTSVATEQSHQTDVSPALNYELNIIEKLPSLSDEAKQLISQTIDALIDGNQQNVRFMKAYFDALNRIRH